MKIKMNKQRYIAVNVALFAVLYLTVTFNKEFIRPVYGSTPIIGILTGSFSNFMAAYIISFFSLSAILSRKLEIKKSRYIFYSIASLVFILLTIEEIKPYVSASKVYDIYDIIASALGAIFAIFTFEIFFAQLIRGKNNRRD